MKKLLIAGSVMIAITACSIDPVTFIAPTCDDGTQNGLEIDVDCGGGCAPCAVGEACAVDADCESSAICDPQACRVARSCDEILQHHPGASDGTYLIAPSSAASPFQAVCDMIRDGGGWTLLLKSNGDNTFQYGASAWTDDTLLRADDLTTQIGNAKYEGFLSLLVTTLRGEIDGFTYTHMHGVPGLTAREIFAGPDVFVNGYPTFNTGAPNWSTQPNCQIFGVNTPYEFASTRFGWSANQENDCLSNDTSIGLGLNNGRGAGYRCGATGCSAGNVDTGGHGLLWAK